MASFHQYNNGGQSQWSQPGAQPGNNSGTTNTANNNNTQWFDSSAQSSPAGINMGGSMGGGVVPMQPMQPMQPMTPMQPNYNHSNANTGAATTPNFGSSGFGSAIPNFDHEPPLLEELGVNPKKIYLKTITVINPMKAVDESIMDDADLAGPITFVAMLGTCLLLRGKLQYGHLFGLLVFGSFGLYLLLNLMSQIKQIDFFRVLSIVGYSMLPMVGLASMSIAVSLRGYLGLFIGLAAVAWCTQTSTRFFVASLEMQASKWLITYPVAMYYCVFVLVTVF
jgi:protein YIPF5/7